MRIGLIAPGGFDRSGRKAVIPALLNLTERLARRHQVTVVVLHQEPEPCRFPLLGAEVINLGQVPSAWPDLISFHRLHRMMTELGAVGRRLDVLHAFWISECGVLAGLAGRLWRVPVVVSVGGGELAWVPEVGYGGGRHWHSRSQAKVALQLANAVTVGSHYARRPLDGLNPQPRVVPLGVDTTCFHGSAQRLDGPPWRLIHVASINKVKNQGMCLQALRLVADRLPGIRLDLVGEDWLNGALHRMADELGLADVVHFHGWLEHEAMVPLLRQAHLYLQSSWYESQGVAVCEAVATGVPAVGTPVGLVADLAPEAAWVVPHDDAGAMADAILTLLHDRQRRELLGQAGQDWAREHDADWTAVTFESIYRQLCSR
jgi:glycosyltransferase involved in cell wall biosynthesis